MRQYTIAGTDLSVSRIAYGCMGLGGTWDNEPLTGRQKSAAVDLVVQAFEQGINLFDHADIYARGKSEMVFAELWQARPDLRAHIILQTKCGIRVAGDPDKHSPGRYDFSYQHIVESVAGSLRRLQTDYVDILLLHRPDPLVQPEEVARAFDSLQRSGSVRHFGVSNHTAGQMQLLSKFVDQPLVINQVELSLLHAHLIDEGIMANQVGQATALASGTLDHCRAHEMLIQAWAPVARGALLAPARDADRRVQQTADAVARLAAEKQTSAAAIALAWLLCHPAPIQPIVGTMNRQHLAASCLADDICLTREQWYALYVTARGAKVP